MNGRIRTDDTKVELIACYVSGINSLHGKLARIVHQHREMNEAVRRMSVALRTIEQLSRR